MDQLPVYIPFTFTLTTALCIYWFYRASSGSFYFLTFVLLWLLAQSLVALTGFYTITTGFPPRFILLIGPAFLSVIVLFLLPQGRAWIDQLDIKTLTLIHAVRFPVELVLYWLSLQKVIPGTMTFEGRNLDVLSGISAAAIYYFAFVRGKIGRTTLILWNFICLCLLLNIVSLAILSAPTDFQQFDLNQPNIAVFYFPYIWLPGCIVPLVLLAHLASLRKLFSDSATVF